MVAIRARKAGRAAGLRSEAGGTVHIPTLDIISTERNIIGNIVGTYNDLAELMALAQAGRVTLHTRVYPLGAAADAFADPDAGRVRGRAILVP